MLRVHREPSDDDRVWVVVPAYNEATRLGATLADLQRHVRRQQIVVIDDGSRDATAAVARQYGVWSLRHPINIGQGAALQTGITFALQHGAEVVVTFDADGQHCSDEIPAIIRPILLGEADVCLGSRFLGKVEGITWSRFLLLKAAILFTWAFSGVRLSDTHNGFRAFSRKAALALRLRHHRMAHASEIIDEIARHQLTYREVPVTVRYSAETRLKGQSGWNSLRLATQLILARLVGR